MSRWSDLAVWVGPTVNCDGELDEVRGLVLHIAQGYYQGTINWQLNPAAQVSSHFIVSKKGDIAQMVDTDIQAWTQADGNCCWLSSENEGFVPDALTPAQIEGNAQLLARAHREYGVALQVASSPQGWGLGHHSMGAECGADWGHDQCPGQAIINQKQSIVDRAREIVSGDMPLTQDDAQLVARAVVNQWLGSSGPSVGTALQSTYHYTEQTLDLLTDQARSAPVSAEGGPGRWVHVLVALLALVVVVVALVALVRLT